MVSRVSTLQRWNNASNGCVESLDGVGVGR